jgi:phosphate transport system permease protein
MDMDFTQEPSVNVDTTWLKDGVRRPAVQTLRAASGRLREIHFGDRLFSLGLRGISIGVVLLLVLIAAFLAKTGMPAIRTFGWDFVTSSVWDPVRDVYGALPVIYGTVVSSILAILIAAPFSVGIALFLNELAPKRIANLVGFLVEMLAAIPSVVYGLWGVFVLAPWLRETVEPFFIGWLGFIPLFQGPPYGVGMLAAGIILAVMVIPTISSISREVFRAIPQSQREAALALGATRWEMMRLSVLRSSKTGILASIVLGLGRALGETMAVTMVIGNRAEISASLFGPAQTMASVIANEYAEATSDMHLAALAEIGFVLFAVTFIINSVARLFIWHVTKRPKVT